MQQRRRVAQPGAYGDIRGWDARTGKLLWTFHTVPRPGEAGSETWPADAWKNRSGTNVWGFFSVDVKRGSCTRRWVRRRPIFTARTGSGDNLYGNSLVALDARTGEKKWHRQLVHHDLWDYDLAAPPALFDIRRGGRTIPAVAQITKMGLLFVFDRVTGEPVYGVEERPVPQTAIPGEVTAKTQPFPVKPPPLGKNTLRADELYDRSPEHARFCKELFETNHMTIGPPYTPLPLEGNALFFPSTLGGGNWGGVSIDPARGLLFANVMHIGQWGHMEKRGAEYTRASAYGPYARFWDRETHVPCQNPPFGEMIAVDLASGDIAWRSPLGQDRVAGGDRGARYGIGESRREHRDGGRGGVHRSEQRRAVSRVRFEDREAALGDEARSERPYEPDHVYGAGRPAVRRTDGVGGRGLSGRAGEQQPGGVRAAGRRAEATAGGGDEGGGGGEAGESRGAGRGRGGRRGTGRRWWRRHARRRGAIRLDVVKGQRMTKAEWTSVVRNMVSRGATASEAEVQAIIEYLAKNQGKTLGHE